MEIPNELLDWIMEHGVDDDKFIETAYRTLLADLQKSNPDALFRVHVKTMYMLLSFMREQHFMIQLLKDRVDTLEGEITNLRFGLDMQ